MIENANHFCKNDIDKKYFDVNYCSLINYERQKLMSSSQQDDNLSIIIGCDLQ